MIASAIRVGPTSTISPTSGCPRSCWPTTCEISSWSPVTTSITRPSPQTCGSHPRTSTRSSFRIGRRSGLWSTDSTPCSDGRPTGHRPRSSPSMPSMDTHRQRVRSRTAPCWSTPWRSSARRCSSGSGVGGSIATRSASCWCSGERSRTPMSPRRSSISARTIVSASNWARYRSSWPLWSVSGPSSRICRSASGPASGGGGSDCRPIATNCGRIFGAR